MKLVLVLSCLIAVVSDMSLVWWAKKADHPVFFLILGFLLLNLAGGVWVYTMREGIESAMAITFYAIATAVGCSFLGVVIFKEPLSLINSIGMALGLVSLVFVSMGPK